MPTNTCTEKSGRRKRIVTPSAARSATSTAAVALVSRAFPSVPPSFVSASSIEPSSAAPDERMMKAAHSRLISRDDNAGVRLLVVEDEVKMAELLARGLREEGHAVDI